MLDGALSFMAMFFGYRALGQFADRTGSHLLGGGAHYYDTYETKDGLHLAVAPIEPQFYEAFLKKMGLTGDRWRRAGYPAHTAETVAQDWPALKIELTAIFKSKNRAEWSELFAGSDACVTPVLTLSEAAEHPHNRARQAFIEVGGLLQNAPAPRFSRTMPAHPRPPARTGSDTQAVLADWGIDLNATPTP
jgi:alpha-methylacyl-CoA racemase